MLCFVKHLLIANSKHALKTGAVQFSSGSVCLIWYTQREITATTAEYIYIYGNSADALDYANKLKW